MRVPVNPQSPDLRVDLNAAVDPLIPVALVPRQIGGRLRLPPLEPVSRPAGSPSHSYARFERDGNVAMASVLISTETEEVVLGLSTLTALLLEVDRQTGELREFEPLLL